MSPAKCLVAFASALLIATLAGAGRVQGQAPSATTGTKSEELPLTAVLPRTNDVFVATVDGLYRAERLRRQWRPLATPANLPFGGRFAQQPLTARIVYYFVSTGTLREQGISSPSSLLGRGLYRSRDNGRTWLRVSSERDFEKILLHPNGALYAIVQRDPPGAHFENGVVVVSKDAGKTWRDLCEPSVRARDLFQDPVHPDRIALSVQNIRGYVWTAEDASYRHWRQEAQTLIMGFGGGSSLVGRQATRANYFDYDFGDKVQIWRAESPPSRAE